MSKKADGEEDLLKSFDLSEAVFNGGTTAWPNEKAVSEISMKDFLDFLKISYQVNETIAKTTPDSIDKACLDWKKLTANELIKRLKERETVFFNEKASKSKNKVNIITQSKCEDENVETRSKCKDQQLFEILPDVESSLQRQSSLPPFENKITIDRGIRNSSSGKKVLTSKIEGSDESETFDLSDCVEEKVRTKVLKKKLNEVLQEGIFDSILPYLLPKQPLLHENSCNVHSKSLNFKDLKKSPPSNPDRVSSVSSQDKMEFKKKSGAKNLSENPYDRKDTEVVIHVCDEIKNLRKDFKCSQKLLISQMGYFAEVTNGQKLEDMDISVHCDVTIFDWLMRWVQKENHAQKNWPLLDSSIVIPVLMSSAFLQMASLQEYCLQYCQAHLSAIVRDSPNLGCINDNILTRLANLFSNVEIENIVDKKDKIQSKLFCKLIVSLSETEPNHKRGHYSSISTLFRCSKCFKLILKNMSSSIPCVPMNMTLNHRGCTQSNHYYDSSWNLTDYIRDLKASLKTWRKVYWKLWADCHYLYCSACEEYFPAHEMSWCKYHTDPAQYIHMDGRNSIFHPVGKYTCCGERTYRFEILKKPSGCSYRDHILNTKTVGENETLRIWNLLKNVINIEPPSITTQGKLIKSVVKATNDIKFPIKEDFWWCGIKLVPSKQSPGLLTKMWENAGKKDDFKFFGNKYDIRYQKSQTFKSGVSISSNTQELSSCSDSSDEVSSSSNADNSEESCHSIARILSKAKGSTCSNQHLASTRLSFVRKEKKKKKKKKSLLVRNDENRFWLPRLSTRSNQDNQRDFEEKTLRQLELVIAKKISGESFKPSSGSRSSYQNFPPGGLYVKLEQEWREAHCFSQGCPGSAIKARGSYSFTNMNNSSFTFQKRSKSKGHR